MSACREVIDICYPVHLLNIILPFNSFDRNCFPPCQSQLVEGSRDWTSTGGQEYRNYRQRREAGGYLLVMFDVIYPTAPGVHLNGGALWRWDIDRVVLSIGLLGARVAEKAAVRIWVTVHHNYLIQTAPHLLLLLRPVVRKERRRRRRKRSEEGESDKSPQLMEKSGLTRWRGVSARRLPQSENL